MFRLLTIQVSLPRRVEPAEAPAPDGGAWSTGFFKQAVFAPVWLGRTNVAGDGQGDTQHHGGPDKAVLAYAAAHYPAWRAELAAPDLPHGAFGENFTVEGLDEDSVCIGDIVALGAARLQVSQPRQPCWKIAARWQRKDLTALVERSGRTGWYLRVLEEAMIEPGLELRLLERPHPSWTITVAARAMADRTDLAGAEELASLPPLAVSWQQVLRGRLDKAAV